VPSDHGDAQEDLSAGARKALEDVCARGDFDAAPRFYREDFVDHVNDADYHGLDGVRESVAVYRSVLKDLRIEVLDQITEGERVVSRWQATGTNHGRQVSVWGITISHFQDGRIAEDWSASDSLGLLRSLGLWRALLVGLGQARGALARRSADS
jgi:predicted ester cyclase